MTIKTQGEGNFRNVSDLYLVMNYTDAAGVAHKVSSPVLPVQIVPTADEGVEFRYSLVQTLRTAHGELNPYILYTDVNIIVMPRAGSGSTISASSRRLSLRARR